MRCLGKRDFRSELCVFGRCDAFFMVSSVTDKSLFHRAKTGDNASTTLARLPANKTTGER